MHSFWTDKDDPETALYGASGIANCAPLTQLLLDAGALVAGDGESLYHAAEFKDHKCLKLLLAKAPKDKTLSYCMCHKMDTEDPAGVKLFLDHGADANYLIDQGSFTGLRPLHFAINRHRSHKIIRMLLDHGADPNLPDGKGVMPYALASRLGHNAAARLLLKAGARDELDAQARRIAAIMSGRAPKSRGAIVGISSEDQILLPHAAAAGKLRAVRVMLDLGWNIETPGEWNSTALHQAAWHGHPEIVKLLLSRGANTDHKSQYGGDALTTAIHGASYAGHKRGVAVVQLFVERLRGRDLFGYLEYARGRTDLKVIKLLEKTAFGQVRKLARSRLVPPLRRK